MEPQQKLADMPHVLVVDDDDRIRQLVGRFLTDNGFIVCAAESADAARATMKILAFDALVVDVMMPGQNGFDFTRELRRDSDIPVILLTALGEAQDRVGGLESGADDYLTKPFEPRELVLRLQAILRRRAAKAAQEAPVRFRIGRWRYDPDHKELRDGDNVIRLTTVEDNLIVALSSRAGIAVSREELAGLCGLDAGERTIDVQVTRLRRKIEADPKLPRLLQTVRGKGYLLRVENL